MWCVFFVFNRSWKHGQRDTILPGCSRGRVPIGWNYPKTAFHAGRVMRVTSLLWPRLREPSKCFPPGVMWRFSKSSDAGGMMHPSPPYVGHFGKEPKGGGAIVVELDFFESAWREGAAWSTGKGAAWQNTGFDVVVGHPVMKAIMAGFLVLGTEPRQYRVCGQSISIYTNSHSARQQAL